MARPSQEYILEYASRIREIPGALMWVMLPGGMIIGQPGLVRKHFDIQLQAQPEEYRTDTENEKSAAIAFENARCYVGSNTYNAGMILIDPAKVSVWGFYDPEKNTFEKA